MHFTFSKLLTELYVYFIQIIEDKKYNSVVPFILEQVCSSSVILTVEHKSYAKLGVLFSEHATVCHNYQFIGNVTVFNIQAVESFNNEMKLDIKRRKGVKHKTYIFFSSILIYSNNMHYYLKQC